MPHGQSKNAVEVVAGDSYFTAKVCTPSPLADTLHNASKVAVNVRNYAV